MTRARLPRATAAVAIGLGLAVLPACAPAGCDDAAGDTSTAVLADDDCGEDDD